MGNKYESILSEIAMWMDGEGRFIELKKEPPVWIALVKDGNGVYYGYTFGRDNQDFLFELLEFCHDKGFPIVMSHEVHTDSLADDFDSTGLYMAQRSDNGEWIEGYLLHAFRGMTFIVPRQEFVCNVCLSGSDEQVAQIPLVRVLLRTVKEVKKI